MAGGGARLRSILRRPCENVGGGGWKSVEKLERDGKEELTDASSARRSRLASALRVRLAAAGSGAEF